MSKSLALRRARRRLKPATLLDPTEAQIARIDALTATGRTNWFVLLAYLAFVLVTTLGVEDVDFFVDTRPTDLPLVGVAIPTFSFFVFAPILGAALYVYLHLHIRKVSEALADPPPGSPPLEERIKPWLLNDTILRQRRDGAIRPRPLDRLASLTTLLLVWWAGPIVLGIMWWRTWPAHAFWLSALCVASLMAAVYAGSLSWAKMRSDIHCRRATPVASTTIILLLLCLPIAWLTAVKSKGIWQFTGDFPVERRGGNLENIGELPPQIQVRVLLEHVARNLSTIASPDLTGARLSVLPPEEVEPHSSRHRYRRSFCLRHDIPGELCGGGVSIGEVSPQNLRSRRMDWCETREMSESRCRGYFEELDKTVQEEWDEHRTARIADLVKPSLGGIDLRGARLLGAGLVGVSFAGARLDGADMRGANLEHADLQGAALTGARLGGARLTNATLADADLTRADFARADLHRADLRRSRLTLAGFEGARMDAARLRGAEADHVEGSGYSARFAYADMRGADLHRARLGNINAGGANLTGANLAEASLAGSNFAGARMAEAIMHRTDLSSANLFVARFEEVLMSGTDFSKADLSWTYVSGSPDQQSSWRITLSEAILHGTAFRQIALGSAAIDLTKSFGDGTVLLPQEVDRPCQWSNDDLSDDEFYAAWRGWMGQGRVMLWTDQVIPTQWLDVEPVPPPPGCTWHEVGTPPAPAAASEGTAGRSGGR